MNHKTTMTIVLVVVFLVSCSSQAPSQIQTSAKPASADLSMPSPQITMDMWIQRLGWQDMDARIEAYETLKSLGIPITPKLEDAFSSKDFTVGAKCGVLELLTELKPNKYDQRYLFDLITSQDREADLRLKAISICVDQWETEFSIQAPKLYGQVSARVRAAQEKHMVVLGSADDQVASKLDSLINSFKFAEKHRAELDRALGAKK